jgi:hypothetical protein
MARESSNLGDILERVLDRGIVIAGDIRVNLLDIELLTIKLRLVIASVDTARELGIDWWEHDPWLSGRDRELREENRRLRERLAAVEDRLGERLEERVVRGEAIEEVSGAADAAAIERPRRAGRRQEERIVEGEIADERPRRGTGGGAGRESDRGLGRDSDRGSGRDSDGGPDRGERRGDRRRD